MGLMRFEKDSCLFPKFSHVQPRSDLGEVDCGRVAQLILEVGPATGDYPSEVRTWRIVLHDVHRSAHVRIGGVEQDVLRIPDARMLVIEVACTNDGIEIEFTGG